MRSDSWPLTGDSRGNLSALNSCSKVIDLYSLLEIDSIVKTAHDSFELRLGKNYSSVVSCGKSETLLAADIGGSLP